MKNAGKKSINEIKVQSNCNGNRELENGISVNNGNGEVKIIESGSGIFSLFESVKKIETTQNSIEENMSEQLDTMNHKIDEKVDITNNTNNASSTINDEFDQKHDINTDMDNDPDNNCDGVLELLEKRWGTILRNYLKEEEIRSKIRILQENNAAKNAKVVSSTVTEIDAGNIISSSSSATVVSASL